MMPFYFLLFFLLKLYFYAECNVCFVQSVRIKLWWCEGQANSMESSHSKRNGDLS